MYDQQPSYLPATHHRCRRRMDEAGEVGILMLIYNGIVGKIKDGGKSVVKLEIPPLEKKTRGARFDLVINQSGVTAIGLQAEMVKEISDQGRIWGINDDKTKEKTFALTEYV